MKGVNVVWYNSPALIMSCNGLVAWLQKRDIDTDVCLCIGVHTHVCVCVCEESLTDTSAARL